MSVTVNPVPRKVWNTSYPSDKPESDQGKDINRKKPQHRFLTLGETSIDLYNENTRRFVSC